MTSAHTDTFARDNLPPAAQQPEYLFELPGLKFPAQLNCASELLDRHVHERLRADSRRHVARVGDGMAPCGDDRGGHVGRRPGVGAHALHGATEVVDHHLGAFGREEQRVLTPESATGTGHYAHPSIEQSHHRPSSSR